jgi:hypothetical protein
MEDYPYLEFRHDFYGSTKVPRQEHQELDGLIFPVGDAFWDKHFGMLNYGCKCGVTRVAKWDERVKGMSESDIISQNRELANYDEKAGEYPENNSNGNFVNPGIFDGGGIVSLFEKIESMQKIEGWQKELADATWDAIAKGNSVFADNLSTWVDRLWTGTQVKSRETRSIAVLSREKFEEIQKEYEREFEKKHDKKPNDKILTSPVIFCNGSQLSHAGRIEEYKTVIAKDDTKLLSELNKVEIEKSRSVIAKEDIKLLSELNNADYVVGLDRGKVPYVRFEIKNKDGQTIMIAVKDFNRFTTNTKNSSIITFYYIDK